MPCCSGFSRRARSRARDLVAALPAAAFIGFTTYGLIHADPLPRTFWLVGHGAILALLVAGLVGSIRFLKAFWNDEDELIEHLGSNEGYIPRPRLLPVRVRAVLTVLVLTAFVAALGASYIYNVFAPE